MIFRGLLNRSRERWRHSQSQREPKFEYELWNISGTDECSPSPAEMINQLSQISLQINSKDWCRKGRKGGECNSRCEDFLDEDIRDDIKCAKIIYNRLGFNGWKGWLNRCKARPLPDISRCSYA